MGDRRREREREIDTRSLMLPRAREIARKDPRVCLFSSRVSVDLLGLGRGGVTNVVKIIEASRDRFLLLPPPSALPPPRGRPSAQLFVTVREIVAHAPPDRGTFSSREVEGEKGAETFSVFSGIYIYRAAILKSILALTRDPGGSRAPNGSG